MGQRSCAVEICDTPTHGRGDYCKGHYRRLLAFGDVRADIPFQRKHPEGSTCSVPECGRGLPLVKSFCQAHYTRLLRDGDVGAHIPLAVSMTAKGAPCAIDGCDKAADSRGWCLTHYGRWLRNGDPQVHKRPDLGKTLAERFWPKVDKKGPLGCWIWTASLDGGGYGQIVIMRGKRGYAAKAHRVAYEMLRGDIPEGLVIDHICRTRACVNPDHLRPLTNEENIRIGVWPSAINARKTHCIHGHAFTEENTYRPARGGRQCRTCQKARSARQASKKKATRS